MSNSCVKTRSIGLRTYASKLTRTAKMYVSPTMTNGFEMCGVFNVNDGLWGLSRLLEANQVVVGGRFSFRYIGIFGRRRIDGPQKVSSMLKYKLLYNEHL